MNDQIVMVGPTAITNRAFNVLRILIDQPCILISSDKFRKQILLFNFCDPQYSVPVNIERLRSQDRDAGRYL